VSNAAATCPGNALNRVYGDLRKAKLGSGYNFYIAVRCLVRLRDPILPCSDFAEGMQFGEDVYRRVLPEGTEECTPYTCIQALLRCYEEEVGAGHLKADEQIRRYINNLDQGGLGSHACVVLKKADAFDVRLLRNMYAQKGVVEQAINTEEDKERAKMGIRTGRLLDAARAYAIGAVALGGVQDRA
jgi:hypothetical protein